MFFVCDIYFLFFAFSTMIIAWWVNKVTRFCVLVLTQGDFIGKEATTICKGNLIPYIIVEELLVVWWAHPLSNFPWHVLNLSWPWFRMASLLEKAMWRPTYCLVLDFGDVLYHFVVPNSVGGSPFSVCLQSSIKLWHWPLPLDHDISTNITKWIEMECGMFYDWKYDALIV